MGEAGVREAGVCWVYAYAAVTGLQALSGRFVAMGKAPPEPPAEPAAEPVPVVPDLVAAGAPPAPIISAAPAPAPQPPRPQPRQGSFLGQRSGSWLRR